MLWSGSSVLAAAIWLGDDITCGTGGVREPGGHVTSDVPSQPDGPRHSEKDANCSDRSGKTMPELICHDKTIPPPHASTALFLEARSRSLKGHSDRSWHPPWHPQPASMAGVDALLIRSSRDFSHLTVGACVTFGCSVELPASSATPAGGDAEGWQPLMASPGVGVCQWRGNILKSGKGELNTSATKLF